MNLKKTIMTCSMLGMLSACGNNIDIDQNFDNLGTCQQCSNPDFGIVNDPVTVGNQENVWECTLEDQTVFQIHFFRDGKGSSNKSGDFTWKQNGCRDIVFQSPQGDFKFSTVQGTVDSGVLTGEFSGAGFEETLSASCFLKDLP